MVATSSSVGGVLAVVEQVPLDTFNVAFSSFVVVAFTFISLQLLLVEEFH